METRKQFIESHPVVGAVMLALPIGLGGSLLLLLLGLPLFGSLLAGFLAFVGGAIPAWWMLRKSKGLPLSEAIASNPDGTSGRCGPSQCDSEQVVEVGDADTAVTATVPDPTELVDQYPLLDEQLDLSDGQSRRSTIGRFVRSREWPPTSGAAVRSVFGLLAGIYLVVLGVVRLDPYALLVSLIALPFIALWPKKHGGPPK